MIALSAGVFEYVLVYHDRLSNPWFLLELASYFILLLSRNYYCRKPDRYSLRRGAAAFFVYAAFVFFNAVFALLRNRGLDSFGTCVGQTVDVMSNCAIVGINWGDEGKGRMVDLITRDYDVVIRYQGGGNAGHTVVNEYGKFALHLLPSGIFRKNVVNVLGNGVALDCENLWSEIRDITDKGVPITPENLKISDRASLLLPWHRELDGLEEARLKDKKYGSTKQGIAPFYSDKFQKKTIMALLMETTLSFCAIRRESLTQQISFRQKSGLFRAKSQRALSPTICATTERPS